MPGACPQRQHSIQFLVPVGLLPLPLPRQPLSLWSQPTLWVIAYVDVTLLCRPLCREATLPGGRKRGATVYQETGVTEPVCPSQFLRGQCGEGQKTPCAGLCLLRYRRLSPIGAQQPDLTPGEAWPHTSQWHQLQSEIETWGYLETGAPPGARGLTRQEPFVPEKSRV